MARTASLPQGHTHRQPARGGDNGGDQPVSPYAQRGGASPHKNAFFDGDPNSAGLEEGDADAVGEYRNNGDEHGSVSSSQTGVKRNRILLELKRRRWQTFFVPAHVTQKMGAGILREFVTLTANAEHAASNAEIGDVFEPVEAAAEDAAVGEEEQGEFKAVANGDDGDDGADGEDDAEEDGVVAMAE